MHRYTAVTDSDRGAGEDEKPPTVTTSTSRRNLITTALLMLISGITGALILSVVQGEATISPATASLELKRLRDLLSVPTEPVIFEPNELFASPASPQTDEAWEDLLGPSKGFIALEDPETYGLAPGRSLKGSKHQIYGVTMFHELHCLAMLRDIHFGLLQGKYNASDYDASAGSDKSFIFEHTEHCFDFLQQSIRCAGLLQIELPRGSRKNVFDGYGSEHTCKSWTSIVQFMDKFQVPSGGSGHGVDEDLGS